MPPTTPTARRGLARPRLSCTQRVSLWRTNCGDLHEVAHQAFEREVRARAMFLFLRITVSRPSNPT